jgi:predicted metal-binding membrane protein
MATVLRSGGVIARLEPRLSPLTVGHAVVAFALVAWMVTVWRMRGMDMGPGTDLGGLGWYLGVWVTMTAAMMLPSTLPMMVVVGRASPSAAWPFAAGYLIVWTLYGLAAYAVARVLAGADFLAWGRAGPYVAGCALAAAGIYQLTPLKRVCLRHCRNPLAFVVRRWREGSHGAVLMGVEHGGYCVGCCWGLMLVLFVLGVMSLLWMAIVTAMIFAEKVLPGGEWLSTPLAVLFIGAGVWLAAAPGSFPGLVQP